VSASADPGTLGAMPRPLAVLGQSGGLGEAPAAELEVEGVMLGGPS
jgi:hypothetical protein